MKKQPLVMVALLFIAGIALYDKCALDWKWAALLASTLLLVAIVNQSARRYLLPAILVLTGAANLGFRTAIISPFDIRTAVHPPEIATIRGRLTETPYQRVYERGHRETWRTIAFVELQSITHNAKTNTPAVGTLAVSTTGVLPPYYCEGQTVEITGVLQEPSGPMAEGMFDYRTYLRRLGIHYQLQVSSTNDWRAAGPLRSPPLSDRFLAWAQGALAKGLPETDEPVRLLWAMTLGWKTALSGEVSEPFMRSGTMHVFAISGLHIALIALMIVMLLRCLTVPRSA